MNVWKNDFGSNQKTQGHKYQLNNLYSKYQVCQMKLRHLNTFSSLGCYSTNPTVLWGTMDWPIVGPTDRPTKRGIKSRCTRLKTRILRNKAGYTATKVVCGWAGAIFEANRSFGQEQWGQRNKIIKKSKVWPTDRPTDRQTKRVVESHARE